MTMALVQTLVSVSKFLDLREKALLGAGRGVKARLEAASVLG